MAFAHSSLLNSTFLYSPFTTPPHYLNSSAPPTAPLCPDWPRIPHTTLIPTLYSIICVVGIVGNALAVCVLAHGGGARKTVANTFMLNLCISDLLFLLSLPLWAVYYSQNYHWPFGRVACKLCGGLLHLNLYASIYFITCMSMDRYVAIVHPLRSQSARYPNRAQLACVVVWILACASTVPNLVLRDTHLLEEHGVEVCGVRYPSTGWFLGLASMKITLAFLLPLAVISCCYCVISRHLLGSLRPGGVRRPLEPSDRPSLPGGRWVDSERPPTPCINPCPSIGRAPGGMERVLWMVAAVVLAFFLCWFPFHCVTLLDMLWRLDCVGGCWVDWAVTNLTPLSLCLGFANSALNPVIYCFIGKHFRGHLGSLCKSLCACLRGPGEPSSQNRGSFSTRLTSFSRKLSDLKDLATVESPASP